MLVVAIIGLLAAIAIPKFANLVVKAKEASVRGKIGSVRSAMSIYYADNEGNRFNPFSPYFFDPLIPKYIDDIPMIEHPAHPDLHPAGRGFTISVMPDDSRWSPLAPRPYGIMVVPDYSEFHLNCTHSDTKGVIWSTF